VPPAASSAPASPGKTPSASPSPQRKPGEKSGPLGAPGKWRLDWREEFRGSAVDLGRWRPNWLADSDTAITTPINDLEYACYNPANATVKKGTLRLKAERQACRTHDGMSYGYTSAIVESAQDYQFTYGFAEARIYLPPSDGSLAPKGSCGPNWGVFLLNGRNGLPDGEIDVMECLSDNDVAWHYHWGTIAEPLDDGGYPEEWRADMPGTSGWHTFGVDWEPGRLTFYYDGVEVGVQEEGVTGKPHYLVVALAISGSAVAVPQTMQVDYVRVWKRRP
jgi:beta-glucanase (GH16 family)